MTPSELLNTLARLGVTLKPQGTRLHYRAPRGTLTPELREILGYHKAELLRYLRALPPSGDAHAEDRNEAERAIIAVKVWSAVLQEAVWVVGDDLPRHEWPTDASVYTQAKVKILTKVDQDTLKWVQVTKELFKAKVVGRRKYRPWV